ncbi:hypothetical protein A1395_09085 [Pseudomonas protegens]|nr:hypothetical protein A1395_09085 [Pseudomonas protegens]
MHREAILLGRFELGVIGSGYFAAGDSKFWSRYGRAVYGFVREEATVRLSVRPYGYRIAVSHRATAIWMASQ